MGRGQSLRRVVHLLAGCPCAPPEHHACCGCKGQRQSDVLPRVGRVCDPHALSTSTGLTFCQAGAHPHWSAAAARLRRAADRTREGFHRPRRTRAALSKPCWEIRPKRAHLVLGQPITVAGLGLHACAVEHLYFATPINQDTLPRQSHHGQGDRFAPKTQKFGQLQMRHGHHVRAGHIENLQDPADQLTADHVVLATSRVERHRTRRAQHGLLRTGHVLGATGLRLSPGIERHLVGQAAAAHTGPVKARTVNGPHAHHAGVAKKVEATL